MAGWQRCTAWHLNQMAETPADAPRQEGRRCRIKWSSHVSDGTTWWIKKNAPGWGSAYPDPGNFVGKHETVAHFWKLELFLKGPPHVALTGNWKKKTA